ncbi:hypothetical protein Agabi119p4_5440 [Agaricus bisporus var. burnettii]|uniref:Uncharacterized protein n=1 Tax=Agaricus bisporus var. burnettii TaxID=192524 RepID=A0A8H7F1P5_AGABI|nr:hypothetical protein Agabi119p4_5440 [Agaricus bisporus var. burnettii]
MIPRYANPHAVFEKTQIVSRETLFAEKEYAQPGSNELEEFHSAMKRTLPHFDLEEPRKRQRKDEVEDVQSLPFRLVSNGPPVLVSLQPKPIPALRILEPEAEDDEKRAEERRKQAMAVAVDANWLMNESLKPNYHPSTRSPVVHVTLSQALMQPSRLMIICHNKAVRKTRPPVDRTLLGYPYDAHAKPEPLEEKRRSYECPVVDILGPKPRKQKRRGRRRVTGA